MCRMMLHPGKIIIQEKGKENKHLEGSEENKKGKKNKSWQFTLVPHLNDETYFPAHAKSKFEKDNSTLLGTHVSFSKKLNGGQRKNSKD